MMTALLVRIGQITLRLIGFVGALAELGYQAIRCILRCAMDRRHWADQMEAIGFNSLPLVVITVTFSGMVLAMYTARQLLELGTPEFVGGLIAVAISRELGPVLTAVVAAARSGSAIAAEIGTMKVTEQIDALRSLGTDPVEYLVVPRFWAAVVSLPLITVIADAGGILGGFAVSLSAGLSPEMYFDSVQAFMKMDYFLNGLVKALCFGALIVLVGSYQGFHTGQGAAAVGRSTTRSVVLCILMVYVADYFLTRVFI